MTHVIDDPIEDDLEDNEPELDDEEDDGSAEKVEVALYRITGLVDTCDEHGNVIGQLPIGSEQELPVVIGDEAVERGDAERVE